MTGPARSEAAPSEMAPSEAVRYQLVDGVVTLTMDQPSTRNALTPEILAGLAGGLARAGADPAARVVVLTHTGPAFCAGADLRAETSGSRAAPAVGAGGLPAVMETIAHSPRPVIARLAGHAMGGGVGLAAVCDISVASEDVTLGFTEVRLGVAPAIISVVCLPKLRRGDALELFLTGQRIPATRAAEVGLLTCAVPAADLDATVDRYVDLLLAGGPLALAAAKALVYDVPGLPTDTAYHDLGVLSAGLFASEEGTEGRTAFREKRPAAWIPSPGPPTPGPPTPGPPTPGPPTPGPPTPGPPTPGPPT